MFFWPALAVVVTSTLLVCAGGNVYNNLCDAGADRINRPGTNPVGASLKPGTVWVVYAVLSACGIGLGLGLPSVHRWGQQAWQRSGLAVAEGLSPWVGLLPLAAALLLWAYSRYLQHLPFAGNLAVAVLIALAVLFPAWAAPAWQNSACAQPQTTWDVLAFALLAASATWTREWIKDLQDREGDRAAGGRTAALLLSTRSNRTGLLLTLVPQSVIVLGAPAWLNWPSPMGLVGAALLLPAYGLLSYRMMKAENPVDFGPLSALAKGIMALGLAWMGLLAGLRCV